MAPAYDLIGKMFSSSVFRKVLLGSNICRTTFVTRVIASINANPISTKTAGCSTETHNFDSQFNPDEQQVILQKLNEASDDELSQYSRLTKRKALDLVSYRTNHGNFEKLLDVMHVKGFGSTLLNSICKNIVNHKMSKPSTTARYVIDRTKIHPRYISNQKPAHILACNLQADSISWMYMASDLNVVEWKHEVLFERIRAKYDHIQYQNKLWDMVRELPDTEVCVLEEPVSRNTNKQVSTPVTLNKARMDAIFTTLMTHRHHTDYPLTHTLFKIRPNVIGEYFNLLVGGERVSARQIVIDTSRGQCRYARGVYIPTAILDEYYEQRSGVQEQMAACLLQAVTFYHLLTESDKDVSELEEVAGN